VSATLRDAFKKNSSGDYRYRGPGLRKESARYRRILIANARTGLPTPPVHEGQLFVTVAEAEV
jgi:hypothetical protein